MFAVCAGLGQMAQAEESATPTPKIDPKAEQVIKQLAEHMGGVKSLVVDVSEKGEAKLSERRSVRRDVAYKVAIQRPDKMAVVSTYVPGGSVYCDGKTAWEYMSGSNACRSFPAPKDFRMVLRWGMGSTRGSFPRDYLVAGLLAGGPYEKLVKELKSAVCLGVASNGGETCHRLKLTGRRFELEMWVSTGPKPLLRKILVEEELKYVKRDWPPGSKSPPRMPITVTYENWAVNTKLPPEMFTFKPPEGARKHERSSRKTRASTKSRDTRPDF